MNIPFNPFQPSVAFHIETRHGLQWKPKDCFYVKYNTRLKYSKSKPFFFNNYLLKCAQHILDVFSTENLSIHHKILIDLKGRFNLRKLP